MLSRPFTDLYYLPRQAGPRKHDSPRRNGHLVSSQAMGQHAFAACLVWMAEFDMDRPRKHGTRRQVSCFRGPSPICIIFQDKLGRESMTPHAEMGTSSQARLWGNMLSRPAWFGWQNLTWTGRESMAPGARCHAFAALHRSVLSSKTSWAAKA